ncbi:hypothetical protein [Lactobacillus helveticus]|nr:hypothetical protein [Lactobacillus helveticus]
MIKRTVYLNRINPFIDKDIIKVITGIRRSGKSVFSGFFLLFFLLVPLLS